MLSSMPGNGGWTRRALGGGLLLLLAAWAINKAMALVTAVWVPLVVLGSVGLLVAVAVWVRRHSRGGW